MNFVVLFLGATAVVGTALFSPGLRPIFLLPAYSLLAIAGILSCAQSANRSLVPGRRGCILSALVFFGYVLGRIVYSPAEYLARSDLLLALACLILYTLTASKLTSSRLRVAFGAALLILSLADSLIGAVQFFKTQNFMPFDFLPRGDYGRRASGFYGCPNHLAGFLEVAALMALSFALLSHGGWAARLLALYGALVAAAGIVLTGSRGGYLSAFAGFLTFAGLSLLLFRQRMRTHTWYFLATLVVIGVLATGFVAQGVVRNSDLLSFRLDVAGQDAPLRFFLTRAAIEQLLISPIFGTGSGTYLFYGRLFRDAKVLGDPTYAHNDYAQLLAEFGILGFTLFCAFLTVHLWNAWKYLAPHFSRKKSLIVFASDFLESRTEVALVVGAVSSLAAYLVHSAVDFNLHIPTNALVMAFTIGLLANPTGNRAVSHQPSWMARMTRWLPEATLLVASTWLIWAAAPTWRAEYFGDKASAILADWQAFESEELATEAETYAAKAAEFDPRNPNHFYKLAEAKVLLADQDPESDERERLLREAVEAYRSALDLTPQDANLHLVLGQTLESLGLLDEAGLALRRALELDPNSGRVRWANAAHLHKLGRLDEAEAAYKSTYGLGSDEAVALGLQRLEAERKASEAPAPEKPEAP